MELPHQARGQHPDPVSYTHLIRSGRGQEGLSMDHWSSDSYFNRMTVPYIRSSSKDEDILSLLQNNEDGEVILSTSCRTFQSFPPPCRCSGQKYSI